MQHSLLNREMLLFFGRAAYISLVDDMGDVGGYIFSGR